MADDVYLFFCGDLRVRDKGRKQQSMGVSALTAYDPADAKAQTGVSIFHRTVIVTMDGQTSGVSTGADQPVELEIKNGFIIKLLRNRVAYIDR